MAKKKKQQFTNVESAVSSLIKKEFQKKIRSEAKKQFGALQAERQFRQAPIRTQLQQVGEQQQLAQRRQRRFSAMTERAEALEIEAVTLDEVPLIRDMERQRMRKTMVSDKFLIDTEKEVTDSFPD